MSIFAPHIFIYVSTSSVAQWQSNRLLTDRSLVRIQPGEPRLNEVRTLNFFIVRIFFLSPSLMSSHSEITCGRIPNLLVTHHFLY